MHTIDRPAPRPNAALALTIWFVVVAAATGVWRNVPIIDDWTYAWTVEHLLHTGSFRVLDWSSTYPLSQAAWGALWSAVLGFSFASLRISTLVLALVCCIGLYAMLRELDVPPRIARLGALSLAVNPLFVLLSSSFMTDVPFIAFTTVALLCYVRAARRGDARFVWLAGAWSVVAFLVRPVGIVTPVAGLPLLIAQGSDRSWIRRVAVALVSTWAAILATWVTLRHTVGTTSIMARWMSNLEAESADYLRLNIYLLVIVSFYMLPALLSWASANRLWRRSVLVASGVAATAVLLLVVIRTIPVPLRPDQTWSPFELGASRALIDGGAPTRQPGSIAVIARGAALLSTSLLLLALFRQGGPVLSVTKFVGQRFGIVRGDDEHCGLASGHASLATYAAAYLVLTNLLWMYHDRYYLVLVPPLIALVLAASPGVARYPRAASLTLVLFAAIAIVGTRDALRFNQGVRDAWQSLVDAGVPPANIDAGYAWNGWVLYAHPANLAPGQSPLRDVPWVTSARRSEYVIATRKRGGYSVWREVTWRSLPWPGPDRLFVLKADAPIAGH